MSGHEWRDVTRPMYPGMPVWPGDEPTGETRMSRVEDGAPSNVSRFAFSSHAGTHVDPPRHFVRDGGGVDAMDINVLCGPCQVLDMEDAPGHVTAALLEQRADKGATRLLLRTANSYADPTRFHEDFRAITPDAARWLVERGVRVVGIDGPSIEAFGSEDFAVHHALLGAGVAVVEGLSLDRIPAGPYEMVCAPLPWKNGDGAPARVLLRPL